MAKRGSPPRVRGKPSNSHQVFREIRITPACAGKTAISAGVHNWDTDHPRVCGENLNILRVAVYQNGSPPRVRGKPNFGYGDYHLVRITPACAGKTRFPTAHVGFYSDHPRVCGENSIHVHGLCRFPGSPPRVRGKLTFQLRDSLKLRITPACAGKTLLNAVCAAVK